MRAAPPRAGWILRQIKFGGHCIKKLEPISSGTPDFARSACVVALTPKVRSDCVGTPPRAEYRASRPLALPLLSILIFCGGGFFKIEWAAKARGGFLLGKRKCGIQIQKVLAIQSSLRNGEMLICMCLPQTHPCAHNHPRRFEEHYKTAGMAPIKSQKITQIPNTLQNGQKLRPARS